MTPETMMEMGHPYISKEYVDQLIADNDRLRRALEELKSEYEGAGMLDDARRATYKWSLTRIDAALSAPPPDAVKRFEARAKADVLDALVLRLDRPVVGNGDYYMGKEHERLSVIETINEQRETARKEASNG